MIIKARFLKETPCWIRAWVPIKIFKSFFLRSFNNFSREILFVFPLEKIWESDPVKNPIFILEFFNVWQNSLKCWWVKISVGAIIVVWKLFFAAAKETIIATIVLPDPTSPSKRRFIGFSFSKSFTICQTAFLWASVKLKGRFFIKFWNSFFKFSSKIIFCAWPFLQVNFCFKTKSWIKKSSSKANRCRAFSIISWLIGKWIWRIAWRLSINFCLINIFAGRNSWICFGPTNFKSDWICQRSQREESFSVSW